MCGRYYRRSDKQKIAEAFRTGVPTTFEILPSYNAAPQSLQPIVCINPKTLERELIQMRWGLVPYWAKDPKIGYSTIHAKAETLATSPTFREALKRRRCLIPMDGFFEWDTVGPKSKEPYAIALNTGSIFALAGVWETWSDKAAGRTLYTFTVITTDPNELIETFHHRMPVIVAPEDYERWMAPAEPSHLPVDLLRPYPSEKLTAWRVSAAVGNVRNDHPGLIAPFEEPHTGNLF
jgi:putative SOS response-associated peptidase YedK